MERDTNFKNLSNNDIISVYKLLYEFLKELEKNIKKIKQEEAK